MRKRTALLLGLLVLVGLAGAGWLALRTWHPGVARRLAIARLKRGDNQRGLPAFEAYARRFPVQAQRLGAVEVGRPVRLRLEPRSYGLWLCAPALPPPASVAPDHQVEKEGRALPAEVADGPLWLDDERLVYAARRPEQPLEMVVLTVPTWSRTTINIPTPEHFTVTFEAAVALALRERAKPASSLKPDLRGATQPRLLAVSRDGSWLIFRAVSAGTPPNELWRCRPDGSDALRLATMARSCAAVAFAPDGSKLAYFDGPRVCVVGLADQEPRVLQSYPAQAVLQPAAPAWSPDGKALAYGVSNGRTWQTIICPVQTPQAAQDRPRLNALEALDMASAAFLVQSERQPDKAEWALTVRANDDSFTSRVLRPGGRFATLSPNGLRLACRQPGQIAVLQLEAPLPTLKADRLPAETLPERPTGPPEPASPKPDAAVPKRPAMPM